MQTAETHLCGVPDVNSVVGRWWVAHVKPSQEKRLAHDLQALARDPNAADVAYYLPLVRRNSRIHGVTKPVLDVLLPGYLFFAGDDDSRYAVLMTRRVVGLIDIVNQSKFIDQLRGVQIAVEENPKLGLWPKTPVGSQARVTQGPFRGREGIVEAVRENALKVRLILRLDILGASTAVEMPADYVEPI